MEREPQTVPAPHHKAREVERKILGMPPLQLGDAVLYVASAYGTAEYRGELMSMQLSAAASKGARITLELLVTDYNLEVPDGGDRRRGDSPRDGEGRAGDGAGKPAGDLAPQEPDHREQ